RCTVRDLASEQQPTQQVEQHSGTAVEGGDHEGNAQNGGVNAVTLRDRGRDTRQFRAMHWAYRAGRPEVARGVFQTARGGPGAVHTPTSAVGDVLWHRGVPLRQPRSGACCAPMCGAWMPCEDRPRGAALGSSAPSVVRTANHTDGTPSRTAMIRPTTNSAGQDG